MKLVNDTNQGLFFFLTLKTWLLKVYPENTDESGTVILQDLTLYTK